MADDMDSDTCVGIKRSSSPSAVQEKDSRHSSPIVSPVKQQDQECLVKDSSKKVKLSPQQPPVSETHFSEPLEIPDSVAGNPKSSDSVSGFPPSLGVSMEIRVVGFVSEAPKTQKVDALGASSLSASVESGSNVLLLGKEAEAESQTALELKKKQLLEEVEAIFVPAEKTHVPKSNPFKIEVIDDTALIEMNGNGKKLGFVGPTKCVAVAKRNGKQEVKGEKATIAERKNEKGIKMVYSRKELEAMRFVNVAEQKNLWKDIYHGLGPAVAKEYDNMASVKSQKNIHNNSETRKRVEKMEVPPGILGAVSSRGTWNQMNIFVH